MNRSLLFILLVLATAADAKKRRIKNESYTDVTVTFYQKDPSSDALNKIASHKLLASAKPLDITSQNKPLVAVDFVGIDDDRFNLTEVPKRLRKADITIIVTQDRIPEVREGVKS